LAMCAELFGARVVMRPLPTAAYVPGILDAPPIILVPTQFGPLAMMWALAHELGHLRLHVGPGNKLIRSKNEQQANKWAACALIPDARIRLYQNASVDAFIAALSANYEDLPMSDSPSRALAHKIAQYRLNALSVNIRE